MFNIFKKKTPIIEFSCKEWAIRNHAPILPASKFLPEEYKNLPTGKACPFDTFNEATMLTLRMCPAVTNWLNAGYVIPAWADMEIIFNETGYEFKTSNLDYQNKTHPHTQFQGMMERFDFKQDIKIDSPWHIKTAPGYSMMWLPLWFHNTNYQAVPAIVDSDRVPNHNPINLMFLERKTTTIKLGDPLVQIIPFKREEITAVSREYTWDDEKRKLSIMGLNQISKFGWRQYLKRKVNYLLDRKDLDLT